ncbi:MAG: 30S ribosomal protein S16 [Chitinophagales bacterium]|nr:30S ribosomal protein S16 [Chitinophagales bacterium]
MAVRMRLQRHGRKKSPFYHIVVASSTSPRDGKFIERLGYYNPTSIPAQITIDVDKALSWLQHGAEPSTTVNAILRYKGVLYKKHLLRGVKKGAFDLEAAEVKFSEWVKSHEGAVLDHVKKVEDTKAKTKTDEVDRISAKREEKAKAAKKASDEAAQAEVKVEENVTEETPAVDEIVENKISEETPAVEEVTENKTSEETPVVEEVAENKTTEETNNEEVKS